MNWKLLAKKLIDNYSSTFFNINHFAEAWEALFDFRPKIYPLSGSTSSKRALFYSMLVTLSNQSDKSETQIISDITMLLKTLFSDIDIEELNQIFSQCGNEEIRLIARESNSLPQFRNFHTEIYKHCERLFEQKNYFHAVQEACKAYNNKIKELTKSDQDGTSLMQKSFSEKGGLRINNFITESEKNEQIGISSLSVGLISAFRNPTAHENVENWPISMEDCIDILGLVSFLFKKLDKATVVNNN